MTLTQVKGCHHLSDVCVDAATKKNAEPIDHQRSRYPYCIVWTPIPILTWLFPFIGHMGIATSTGVIRDFAGPYFVSEDSMGFGDPTLYWRLDHDTVKATAWDAAVADASEEYKNRMHNLCCDNCHSHVAMALNLMQYKGSNWNMFKLCALMLLYGRWVGLIGFLKSRLPAILIYGTLIFAIIYF